MSQTREDVEPIHIQYRLKWEAGPRPPAHPLPMIGELTFQTFDQCATFVSRQAADTKLISLIEITSYSADLTESLTASLAAGAPK